MELKHQFVKFPEIIRKYRYAIGILLLGFVLMMLPGKSESTGSAPAETMVVSEQLTVEQRLAKILSSVQGVGEVEVMLSVATGERTVYQTDTDTAVNSESSSIRSDTVIVSDSDRNEAGLVTQVDPPVYLGAIVVCQGGGDPSVRLAVVDAVSKYTGLGANQISVLEMK